MSQAQLVQSLGWEHPMMTLDIGTLSANVKNSLRIKDTKKRQELYKDTLKSPEAIKEDAEVASNVISCVQDAVRHANQTKRQCQGLIGMYIKQVATNGVTPDDRLCYIFWWR